MFFFFNFGMFGGFFFLLKSIFGFFLGHFGGFLKEAEVFGVCLGCLGMSFGMQFLLLDFSPFQVWSSFFFPFPALENWMSLQKRSGGRITKPGAAFCFR